jgi:transposase
MEAINILPRFKGRVVHDDLPSYFQYDFQHALCNAHHLRVLLFLQERYPQKWIEPLIAVLLEIKKKSGNSPKTAPDPVECKTENNLFGPI